ncbi:uncharacterized protein LOC106142803 [Amyelois transitella]|uniref:uncharacterized protein LOC106142803 n=1 Tax=Amyelois transitella TaxID=680683 RepID=UPI0029901F17|nr:uncharacterized protein LOC106142803 [Amyelois transitella]
MTRFETNLDFYIFLREGDLKDYKRLHQAILAGIPLSVCDQDSEEILKFSRSITVNLNRRWTAANRTQKTFMNKHMGWLEERIKWPVCNNLNLAKIFEDTIEEENQLPEPTDYVTPSTSSVTKDMSTSTESPVRKPFSDLGNKQKKRRSGTLTDYTADELSFALVSNLKSEGKIDLAQVIGHLMKNPERAHEVQTYLFHKEKKETLEEDQALALATSLDLSKWRYLTLRAFLTNYEGSAQLPSYYKLLKAKKKCYPDTSDIEVTEDGAKVKLQSLLNLTVQRILQVVGEPLNLPDGHLKMTSKWGFDGSSAQSNYRQKSGQPDFDDSSVFMTSLVPLKLESDNVLIWENPKPSSTFYCRPVKFQFAKETSEFIKQEEAAMKEEIRNLTVSRCGEVEISHDLHMTMIDGKIATIITDTPSAATCNICLAKPSEMNNLPEVFSRPVRDEVYQYGLSTLHMWIRSMECLLHISYNMDFEMWCARGENKNLKKARKDFTQQQFKEQMGLLIDIVKQGFGTTNDGNTARKFFREYQKSAQITKIDENLIRHFAVILQVISSGNAINIEKFREYCRETAELFVHLYPWYNMPASVHKLLIHGADICRHFSCLPIGIMSEEASEARNKEFRNTREQHTRKMGRIQNNEDILHNFLITSDPYISHIRPKYAKFNNLKLFSEAIDLLESAVEEEAEMEIDEVSVDKTNPLE